MATALPSDAFTGVQRYLKQRRATGQITTPRSERYAWQAYYDSLAANRNEASMIGTRERQLNLEAKRVDMAKDAQDNAESAARIQGIAELGSTAVMGGMLLKDTSLGAKIGLGGAKTAVPSSATSTAGVGAAPSISGGAAAIPATTYASGASGAVGATGTTAGGGLSAGAGGSVGASASGSASAATGMTAGGAAGAAGVGIGAGFLGATVGNKVAGDKGSVIGGAGAGAVAGAYVAGPYGAIIGGVVGGLVGVLKGNK